MTDACVGAPPKKMKRSGPCDNCGCSASTQWRVGPPNAPTLCNACGVCWGRKHKLPSVTRGTATSWDAESPLLRPPASPLRAEAPPTSRVGADVPPAVDAAESEGADLLLAFAAASSSSTRSRERAVRLARPEGGDVGVTTWTRRRESSTLRGAASGAAAAASARGGGAKRSRTPEVADATPSPAPAAQPAAATAADGQPCTPTGGAGSVTAAPAPAPPLPPAPSAAAVAAAAAAFLWPSMAAGLWSAPPTPAPLAFDLFRAELQAACERPIDWATAHASWLALPTELAGAYQRRASAAAFAAAGFGAGACEAQQAAVPVLPSRVISQPTAMPLMHAAG